MSIYEILIRTPDHLIATEEVFSDAFTIATKYEHPFYDCVYVSLCRKYDATLITIDRRLRILSGVVGLGVLPNI